MRLRTLLAVVLGVVSLTLAVVTAILGSTNPQSVGPPLPLAVAILMSMLAFTAAGVLLAMRRPGNSIGWLFLLIGLAFPMSSGLEEYAVRALVLQPGSLPGGVWAAWLSQWSFILWFGPLPLVLLLFPDGHLPSPRWRPVLIVIVLASAVWALAAALHPGRFGSEQLAGFSNPLGVEAVAPLASALQADTLVGFSFLACALAAIARFRKARALERQQLKLFAYSAGLVGTILAALLLIPPAADLIGVDASGPADALWILLITSFGAVAVAVTVAILRYRLYDIDLLINRTLVYGMTSATIALTFWAGIVVLQTLLRRVTAESELAIAASTLISFALFQPVRRRIQDAVDQRFNRSRYNAARALDAFAVRMRDEVDLDALRAHLLGVVNRTVAPSHVSLWLRSDRATKELASPR